MIRLNHLLLAVVVYAVVVPLETATRGVIWLRIQIRRFNEWVEGYEIP